MSSGAWLLYLDADDELAPDAVEAKMSYAEAADVIYGTSDICEYEGGELARTVRSDPVRTVDPFTPAFQWRYHNTSALMFRRSAVFDVGGWDDRFQNCTDYDLYFRLLLAGKRFVAAPESVSIYRIWSTNQMAYQNPLRLASSQLEVMWRAVLELERRGQLTPAIREAFSNTALSAIRTVFPLDRGRALAEHKRLTTWHQKLILSPKYFSKEFRTGYQIFGLRGAEFLARATRRLRRSPHKMLLT
jgi:glycosyltransferase involved in cell wall biosynthesis